MSENNEKNTRESIESIEKTVEDLKKKIEELANSNKEVETEDKKLEIPNFKLSDEQKEKIDTVKTDTVKAVNDTFDKVKQQASGISSNPDVQKTISFLKTNAMKAVDGAKDAVDDIRSNPNVQKTFTDASSFTSNITEAVKTKYNETFTDEKKAEIREKVGQAEQAVNQFLAKPEVQSSIQKTKEGAKEIAEKGASVLKNIFNTDSEDKEN